MSKLVNEFVLCFSEPEQILKRLCEELQIQLLEKLNVLSEKDDELNRVEEQLKAKSIRDLLYEINEALLKITKVGLKTFIIIDALDKVDDGGQIMKASFPFCNKLKNALIK